MSSCPPCLPSARWRGRIGGIASGGGNGQQAVFGGLAHQQVKRGIERGVGEIGESGGGLRRGPVTTGLGQCRQIARCDPWRCAARAPGSSSLAAVRPSVSTMSMMSVKAPSAVSVRVTASQSAFACARASSMARPRAAGRGSGLRRRSWISVSGDRSANQASKRGVSIGGSDASLMTMPRDSLGGRWGKARHSPSWYRGAEGR